MGAEAITIKADLTDPTQAEGLFRTEFGTPDTVYCLHGIMSRGSEDHFDFGIKVWLGSGSTREHVTTSYDVVILLGEHRLCPHRVGRDPPCRRAVRHAHKVHLHLIVSRLWRTSREFHLTWFQRRVIDGRAASCDYSRYDRNSPGRVRHGQVGRRNLHQRVYEAGLRRRTYPPPSHYRRSRGRTVRSDLVLHVR